MGPLKPARIAFSLSIVGVNMSNRLAVWTFKAAELPAECDLAESDGTTGA
jgi:hypothetical protein